MSLLLLLPAAAVSPTAWKDSWNTALAGVATTPVTVVCIGDSVTEGQGASLRGNRWIARLSNYLHARYPVAVGGEGYVAAQTATGAPDSPWFNWSASSGTNTFITTPGNPGYRALSMALNATLTYTVVGTSVDIWWVRSTSGGSFTYRVDGGTATTVSTAGTASTTQRTSVSLGAAGTHTVLLTCTVAAAVVSGLTVYNGDETKGVRVYEAGHTAWDTNQYLNHTAYADLIAFITALAPDLVTVQLGINDWGHNSVTTTAYKTNLLKLMASLDALPKRPSILLIDSYDLDPTGSANAETQDDYKAKVIEVVNADPTHRGFLDFGATMPFATTSGTGYYSTDGIHPNDSGHIEIARQVINTVTPDPNAGATTLATETWTGTTGAAWPAQWTQVAQTGTATIQSNIGRLLPGTGAYAVAPVEWLSGMTATVDFDITIDVGFHTSALEQYVTVGMSAAATKSTNDVAPSDGYFVQFFPGSSAFGVNRCNANVTTAISGDVAYTYTLGTRINLQFTRRGANLEVYVWNVGAGKPASPNWSGVDAAPYNSAGKVWLGASNGAATTALTATYDNLAVTDAAIASPSPLAPGQPTGLTATPQPGQVVLAWNPPTDAGSYIIYRAGVAIASGVTALTWTDATGVQGTSYAYTVSSVNTVGEGPQSASASAASTTLTPLTVWRAALATVTTAPAKLLAIGDSVTEGQGASTRTNRWLDKLKASLRTSYPSGVTGGDNYLPSGYFVYSPDSTWGRPATTTGTVTYLASSGSLGYRTAQLAAAATWSLSVTGTSVDIWYAAGGTLTYQIDGGTGVPVDTSAATGTDNRVIGVSLGAAGAHTVKVTATTGTNYFQGLTVYNGDTAAGVQVYDSAHTSFTAANHIADGSNEQQVWADIAPDLAVITLGLNDAGTVTVAQFKSNIQIMINALKALPKIPSILLVACYTPDTSVGYSAATWQTYVQGLKDLAAADPSHVAALDLSAVMPQATTAGTGFYRTDGLHPNDSGHTEIANRVSAALVASVAGTVGFAGSGSLTVTPLVTHPGAVTMAGVGTLSVAPVAGTPTTVLVDVGENHYTNSTTPTSTPALTNIVHTSTVLRSFYKFDLPAAPSGGTLIGAKLIINTTNAGDSIQTLTASTCSNSWSESTITWNTQPAADTFLATFTTPAISTQYQVDLPASVVSGFAGSTMSIITTGDNADSTQIWGSRYNIDTTKRPDLQLLYLAPNTTVTGTVLMGGSGALAVTGLVTETPTVGMAGAGSLSVTPAVSHPAAVGFAGSGTLAVIAAVTELATVPMAGAGTLTVAAAATRTGTVAMAGAGTLSVTGSTAGTQSATVAMTGTGSLTVTGAGSIPSAVTMSGAGSLTITPLITHPATVTMAGSGTLTVTPTVTALATVTMAGTGTLTVAGVDTVTATLAMAGVGTLTVTGTTSGASAVAMTGVGTLTVVGTSTTTAVVGMVGAGSLAVTATPIHLATVAFTGSGALTVTPSITITPAVLLAGAGVLTTTASITHPATVPMAGAGVLTVTGTSSGINSVAFTGTGALTVLGAGIIAGVVTMTGTGALTVAALLTHTAAVTLTGTGVLTVNGTRTQPATVPMSGVGALTVTGTTSGTNTVAMAGAGALTVTSTITRVSAVTMAGVGGLTVTAITGSVQTATITMAGTGALSVGALLTHTTALTLTGLGSLTVTSTTTPTGIVPIAGAGTLTIGGTQTHPATIVMSGVGVLNITGSVLPSNTLYNVTWAPGGAPQGNPYTVGTPNGNPYRIKTAHGNLYAVKGI